MWDLLNEREVKEIPREVSYYFMCQKFKCLPDAGGLRDQDPVIMEAFSLIMAVENEHQKVEKAKQEKQRKLQEKKKR